MKRRSEVIEAKIRAGSVTAADFNRLISETSTKSVRERLRRVGEPLDANRMHDGKGHSRVSGPQNAARLAPRKGGGKLNDPKRTARGRGMLRRQTKTETESLIQTYAEAIHFIQENHGKQYTLENIRQPDRLAQLTVRLLRENQLDRDWLYGLHRQLQHIREQRGR